jgi:hypothetical protein
MEQLSFWSNWGSRLPDAGFAGAFTAMGLLAAQAKQATGSEPATKGTNLPPDEKVLTETIGTLLAPAHSGRVTDWKFPQTGDSYRFPQGKVRLEQIDPGMMATAWAAATSGIFFTVRLRITGFPRSEPIKPWFRLLFEALPNRLSAFIEMLSPQASLQMRWPLRLGFLPGNPAVKIVRDTIGFWPSRDLAHPTEIGREYANSDFLLFSGSHDQLYDELKRSPVPVKCNLFVLFWDLTETPENMGQALAALAAGCKSSGFVFLDPLVDDYAIVMAKNRLITSLSHNKTLDEALSEAFAVDAAADPVIMLTDDLAAYRVQRHVKMIMTRTRAMPPSTRITLSRATLNRMKADLEETPAVEDTGTLRHIIKIHGNNIEYERESQGAKALVEITKSIEEAESSEKMARKSSRRFLQAKTFVLSDKPVHEPRGFLGGVMNRIRVRIGPPGRKWVSLKDKFPEEKLPPNEDSWNLTVVLSEPRHIKEPLRSTIRLPRFGASTECDFDFLPAGHPEFEGRISVLHRGRIIQTAVLRARVAKATRNMPRTKKITLSEIIPVRSHLGDLEGRRQYDLAFLTNHTSDKRPRLTAISSKHAWLTNLDDCKQVTKELNKALSKAAKSVADYKPPLDSEKNRALLVELAQLGSYLFGVIVEDQLEVVTNDPEFAELKYLQIVSTKDKPVIPFEFIYDHAVPDDDAKLCPSWQEALKKGECRSGCDKKDSSYVCPLGFWGISKVIERHDVTPELSGKMDYYLQSESSTGRPELHFGGNVMIAASQKVKAEDLEPLYQACLNATQKPHIKAEDWKTGWIQCVRDHHPRIMMVMPHTDGSGTNATLEISARTIKTGSIKEDHVRPDESYDFPIVALLGCDTTGTTLDFGSHVRQFRRKGASMVIGTIATVFGGHAAQVAKMIVEGFSEESTKPICMGEVLRSVKQKALLEGLVMAMCVVAFGDADWKLTK